MEHMGTLVPVKQKTKYPKVNIYPETSVLLDYLKAWSGRSKTEEVHRALQHWIAYLTSNDSTFVPPGK